MSNIMEPNEPNEQVGESINEPVDNILKLQKMMAEQGKKNPIPSRFIVEDLDNCVIIIDGQTGRMSEAPLYAYGDIRKVLNDLFG